MGKTGSTKVDGTTIQHKLFAKEYFTNGGNGTKAAIEAGYSKKTATQTASRLLTYVNVQKYLKKLTDDLASKAVITQERVLEEYKSIGLFDIRTIYTDTNALKNVKDLDDIAGAAIAGIKVTEVFEGYGEDRVHIGNTVEIKLNNKISALDSIRQTLGWFAPTKVAQTKVNGEDAPQLPQVIINGK
jgi:phage terminase small subunit